MVCTVLTEYHIPYFAEFAATNHTTFSDGIALLLHILLWPNCNFEFDCQVTFYSIPIFISYILLYNYVCLFFKFSIYLYFSVIVMLQHPIAPPGG